MMYRRSRTRRQNDHCSDVTERHWSSLVSLIDRDGAEYSSFHHNRSVFLRWNTGQIWTLSSLSLQLSGRWPHRRSSDYSVSQALSYKDIKPLCYSVSSTNPYMWTQKPPDEKLTSAQTTASGHYTQDIIRPQSSPWTQGSDHHPERRLDVLKCDLDLTGCLMFVHRCSGPSPGSVVYVFIL